VPKPIQYRANSIIYFKGDASEKIYILNAGKVSLNYLDIETGQEVHDLIKMGEFFGVKSALGRYPREETAVVLQDSTVMAFTGPEFESLAMKNTRIITKMLKVFSNQLRRIQRQVQNLLAGDAQVNPETGLYKIGEYYLKNKRYGQALHAYKRYLVYYPSGAFARDVAQKVVTAEDYLSKYGQSMGTSLPASPAQSWAAAGAESARNTVNGELSDVAQAYYNAVSLVSQEKFTEAFIEFKKIIDSSEDAEYGTKAEFEMAKCLYYLKQFDTCIRIFTAIVQKFPKHPDLKEALFFIGKSHEDKGDKAKAGGLYKKILTMPPEDDPVSRRARKALKALEGGG
jgi:CRP-like cAMP-binding protein/predicted negative regulator of RcsB-dependent stress response